MQYVFDFFKWLGHNISSVTEIISSISTAIGDIFSVFSEVITSIPYWLKIPLLCMIVLAIVFQVISFIPTESGGH